MQDNYCTKLFLLMLCLLPDPEALDMHRTSSSEPDISAHALTPASIVSGIGWQLGRFAGCVKALLVDFIAVKLVWKGDAATVKGPGTWSSMMAAEARTSCQMDKSLNCIGYMLAPTEGLDRSRKSHIACKASSLGLQVSGTC